MKRMTSAIGLMAALALAGCAAPSEPIAVQSLSASALGLGAAPGAAIASDWWRSFGDAQLDRIITDALHGNPTLAIAMARVRASHAMVASTRGARLPQIALDASEQVQRLSNAYIIPPPYGGSTKWVGDAQANLSWNIDFWGRQAAAIHAAQAEADAMMLDRDAARLALTGAVVQTYVELARAEQQIALAQQMVRQQKNLVGLMQVRVDSKLASPMAVRGEEAQLAAVRQMQLRAEAQRTLLIHALALLAGRGADYYPTIAATDLQLSALTNLPRNLPADLLSRRPDILSARLRIDSAAAGRQVARRAFYPNVNLLGLVGLQALGITELFSSDAFTAGAGAAIHLPIFDGGQRRADYARATAGLDAAIASYNQSVLGAVQEAADALSQIQRLSADLQQQGVATTALRDMHDYSKARYGAGLDTRVDLLRADLTLLGARQQTVNLETDQAIAGVRLLLALGGGFDSGEVESAGIETTGAPASVDTRTAP